ncbi:hypothetical protein FPZ12_033835 [Amycolatopsis acidicola]|uniref:Metallo-beta-lactamase domain-containing protein n=1 Tax=Amycolatopsis acidicola TaxID=2596893 RepID=A0A5N0USF2_9PSEU|nr:hypothetical protein FPZ12_033835 [Amycolatopsis acidicola]
MSRLTVLGSCGAWPEPGRACSGFLLSHNGFRLVLDLGYGTASRLREPVDAVVITHEHPDHCADLSALGRLQQFTREGRLPLYCTPGVLRVLEATEPRPHPRTVFEVHDVAEPATIGPFRLDAWPLLHHVAWQRPGRLSCRGPCSLPGRGNRRGRRATALTAVGALDRLEEVRRRPLVVRQLPETVLHHRLGPGLGVLVELPDDVRPGVRRGTHVEHVGGDGDLAPGRTAGGSLGSALVHTHHVDDADADQHRSDDHDFLRQAQNHG